MSLGAAYLRIGRWTIASGLAIAVAIDALVAILFMQLGRSGALIRLAGLLWFGILCTLTVADILTRA